MDIETRREGDNEQQTEDEVLYSETDITLVFALPIVASFLSLVGSTVIVCILLRKKYNRLSSAVDRIIFGMSLANIISSLAGTLGTLPSPSHIPHTLSNMRFPGYGTTATCTAQGFLYHFGQSGTTLYYCALSIYYVVVMKTKMPEREVRRRIEPFLHAVPILYSFSSGIFLAVTENFNNATSVCWIAPYPVTCRKDLDTCTRGRFAILYRMIFSGIPVIIVFFVILTCMIMLICVVRKQERKIKMQRRGSSLQLSNERDSKTESTTSKRKSSSSGISSPRPSSRLTQKTTTQALMYIAAYFATFIFGLIFQLVYALSRTVIFPLFVMQQATAPAQGFFNFLVFIVPQIQIAHKNNPDNSFFKALLEAIISRGEDNNGHVKRSTLTTQDVDVRGEYLAASVEGIERAFTAQEKMEAAIPQTGRDLEKLDLADDDGELEMETSQPLPRSSSQNSPNGDKEPAANTIFIVVPKKHYFYCSRK